MQMDDTPTNRKTELAAHYEHCEKLLREADRDVWLACLFAPSDARPHLHALHAFTVEVATVREKTTQPLLGEMRLRWWYDALEAPFSDESGGARAHPVADALIDTIERCAIPRAELVDFIEAHVFDLYDEPMEFSRRWRLIAPARRARRCAGAPRSSTRREQKSRLRRWSAPGSRLA